MLERERDAKERERWLLFLELQRAGNTPHSMAVHFRHCNYSNIRLFGECGRGKFSKGVENLARAWHHKHPEKFGRIVAAK